QTPENGRRGVAFVEQLVEMVGEVPLCWKARASFRQMAGDLEGALADLERELALTPEGDWWHGQLRKDLERMCGSGEP
ncbi:MAG: hypothetical protein JRI25_24430, partial [Deltaproteobacteria bacterium]|nr:hypothetical protein [Deltaproteobacteria bacterium]